MGRSLCRVLPTLLLLTSAIWAQRDLGTIVGTVTDPQGGVLPNAQVTITEDSTGLKYSVVTGDNGDYIRPALKPGTYTIEVSAVGFQKAIQRNVLLTAGDRTGANIQLTIGEVTQSVEVTADAPLLQTESTIVGANINSKQVSELPLGGQRTFTFLARLSPGVLPAEAGSRDQAGGGFSANGVRSNGQNNFLLNGVDNNVNVIDFLNQTAYVIGPSVDAIGEMRVMTNGYNAEYGRGAGGVVNVTIKSGSNEIHGSLFEYFQNSALNANRWESNRTGTKKGAFGQNQFGVAVGGPLIKNRTFWFADYQGTRTRAVGGAVPGLGISSFYSVPRPGFANGDFSSLLGSQIGTDALGRAVLSGQIYDRDTQRTVNGQLVRDPFPNNQIPVNRLDPVSRKIIALFPQANQPMPATGFAQNNYFVTTRGERNTDQFDIRIDHRISDKDSLFGTVSWSDSDRSTGQPFPGGLDGTGFNAASDTTLARNAMLSYTRVWNAAVITETRAAFTRLVTGRTPPFPDVDQFAAFGIGGFNPTIPGAGGLPNIAVDRYSGFGTNQWLPAIEYNNVWDFIQNVSINKGGHAYKFGAEYRPIKFPFFQVPAGLGVFNFDRTDTAYPTDVNNLRAGTGDGYASFMLGQVNRGQLSTSNFISSQREAWGFFAQDDWKVTSKLTINYGVRYELFSPIAERFGRQSNFDMDTMTLYIPEGRNQDAPLPPNFATALPGVKVSRGEVDKYLIPWDKTSIAPRIGFAYNILNRTVVRAGYGIFYGGEENQGGDPNRGENVPFNQTAAFDRPPSVSIFDPNPLFTTFQNGFPQNWQTLPAGVGLRGVAKNFRNPLVHKWNFAIQQEMWGGNALEVTYVGNHQAHQLHFSSPNACVNDPRPSLTCDSLRPIPYLRNVNQTTTFGYGNYHGLTAKLEKRFSNGLQYLTSYTYGHALATSGTTLGSSEGLAVKDPWDYSTSYASAGWDRRHNFTGSFLYDLPFGRGKALGGDAHPVVNALVGDWQVNGILTLRTGNPFTLRSDRCQASGNCFPDLVAGKDPKNAPEGGRRPEKWFDTSAVLLNPTPGTLGNLGLQTNNNPGQQFMDLSLFKALRFTERIRAQFRAEAFNLTNTPQWGHPGHDVQNPNFGVINETQAGTERKLQFALRLMF